MVAADADKLPADTGIPGLRSYEEWIHNESGDYAWPQFDERSAAALCWEIDDPAWFPLEKKLAGMEAFARTYLR